MTFLPPAISLVPGIKDEMKPKYHARPPLPPLSCYSPPHHHYHRWRYLYRLHLNLECREFSPILYPSLFRLSRYPDRRESMLLARKAAKNSPVIESILCKPISDPHLSVTMLSSQLVVPPSPFPLPAFCHLRSLICCRRKVLSTPPLPPSYSLFLPRY